MRIRRIGRTLLRISRRNCNIPRQDYRAPAVNRQRALRMPFRVGSPGLPRPSITSKAPGVKEQKVVIENSKIMMYRVYLKVTFVLDWKDSRATDSERRNLWSIPAIGRRGLPTGRARAGTPSHDLRHVRYGSFSDVLSGTSIGGQR